MKKKFLALGMTVFILSLSLLFVGCGGSSSPAGNQIDPRVIGTWDNIDGTGHWVTLNSDGTFTEFYDGFLDTGVFTTSGNSISVTMAGITISSNFSMSNNNNTMRITGMVLDMWFDDTFTRRPQ